MKTAKMIRYLVVLHMPVLCLLQYTSQTYPDPRVDPLTCGLPAAGPVCDPNAILKAQERLVLAQRINQIVGLASSTPNKSPLCRSMPSKRLEVIIAVLEKIGTPGSPVDIEKFANALKSRFQNYQDPIVCDLTVLIVNSKKDRQVYTVAGKDSKLTKSVLKQAFEHNVGDFKAGNYASGLQGMVEYIVEAYMNLNDPKIDNSDRLGQIMPRPSPNSFITSNEIRRTVPTDENVEINEEDQLWVEILTQAVSRCGNNQEKIIKYVRSLVEETMSLSLRLISDVRYSAIEELLHKTANETDEAKDQVWQMAKVEFIDDLYDKYIRIIRKGAIARCPAKIDMRRFVSKFHKFI